MLFFHQRDEGNILDIEKSDQYHTVEELIKRSRPNSFYYTLLILSAIIISSGLLLNNNAIIIGGMLVTPVMTPILLSALGIALLEFGAIRKAGLLMTASFLIIMFIAWSLAKIFTVVEIDFFLAGNPSRSFMLYSLVAFSAGIAATLG
jgi:uncharacterized membrane protein